MELQLILCAAVAVALLGSHCSSEDVDNVKLLKCEQSSNSTAHPDALCNKAIDGNTNQYLSAGYSCSQTQDPGWWKAETEKPALIEFVQIYNTDDSCCTHQLTNFTISVDDDMCYTHDGTIFSVRFVSCFKKGSAVLKIESNKPALTLCEIKVLGKYLVDKLKLSSCKQSSTYRDAKCERAIDGKNQGSCSRVDKGSTGWWKAEAERPALFSFVEIHNNEVCCADALTKFKISVNDKVCYEYDGVNFSEEYFECARKGIELKIESSKPDLSLCEVSAFGKYLDVNDKTSTTVSPSEATTTTKSNVNDKTSITVSPSEATTTTKSNVNDKTSITASSSVNRLAKPKKHQVVSKLYPTALTKFGTWGDWQFCQDGHFVNGFQLQVESPHGIGDDTALNSIYMYCSQFKDLNNRHGIHSNQGFWGSWRPIQNCNGGFFDAIQLRSETLSGIFDDTAANDVQMRCSNGIWVSGGGTHWGRWTNAVYCPKGSAICGIRTQVEPKQGWGDDTALNGVGVACCKL